MDADLDTLATALYVSTDELLKRHPERSPYRPPVGWRPAITDAEMVTLAVMQALLGFTSEARWLRYARAHLHGYFPYLPGQPGYNKRLRALSATLAWLTAALAKDTSLWTDDVWVAESTPIECGRSVVPPESWRAWLCGFPVECRSVLVVDRAHHACRAVPAVVVVEPVAPVQDDGPGLAGVLELLA